MVKRELEFRGGPDGDVTRSFHPDVFAIEMTAAGQLATEVRDRKIVDLAVRLDLCNGGVVVITSGRSGFCRFTRVLPHSI